MVFDTSMIVSRQMVLLRPQPPNSPRAVGCNALTNATLRTNGDSQASRFSRNSGGMRLNTTVINRTKRRGDKPAHRPGRDQHRDDDDDQRHAQFEPARQAGHRAVPVAVMMAYPVVDHGLEQGLSPSGLRTSDRASSSASPKATSVPTAPATAVAPAAQRTPGTW